MFTNRQKLTALSICHIFETSKPLGDSTSVAVLNDGAGISYGIPQATHKSGNLADVIERYVASDNGGPHEALFRKWLPQLRKTNQSIVNSTADNDELKSALEDAGKEPAMRQAQLDNVNARMDKAIMACAGSNFFLPLSLAVVYDSMNHGSWERIRDQVSVSDSDEKAWIKSYVTKRHAWLKSVPRLAVTSYRTGFYLKQIANDNWMLKLPVDVHGFKLTDHNIDQAEQEVNSITPIVTKSDNVSGGDNGTSDPKIATIEDPAQSDDTKVDSASIATKETLTTEDGGEKTVETKQELSGSTDDVAVKKERPSIQSMAQAAFAWILSGGTAIYTGFKLFFEKVDTIPTLNIGIAAVAIIGLAVLAFFIYDKSAERANRLNIVKMGYAADTNSNTVILDSGKTDGISK
jgi:hypothetical protein